MERLDPGDVRLELAQPLGPDQLDAGHAVRDRPAVQLGEARPLGVVVATTTFPQRRIGIPRSSQYPSSRSAPSTQSLALSDPGA